MIRGLTCLLFAACAAFSAFVFAGASSRDQLETLAQNISASKSPEVRAILIDHARAVAAGDWRSPLAWHAGALEGRARIEALAAQEPGLSEAERRRALERSRDAAVRAVELAPVQPVTWFRLADYAYLGMPNSVCKSPTACLSASFQSGLMTSDYDFGCGRLKLAAALEGPIPRKDARIQAFVAGVGAWRAKDCLAQVMTPEDVFHFILSST